MLFTTVGAFAAAALSSATFASAANVAVSVGASGLSFGPDTVTAAVGDSVTFNFAGPHSATQSTFNSPCTPSGFDSGIMNPGGSFTVKINDTNPVWVYCQVPGHCQAGMVFAINAPTTGTNTFQNFQAQAEGKSISSGSSSSSSGSPTSAPASSTASSTSSVDSACVTTTASSGGGGGYSGGYRRRSRPGVEVNCGGSGSGGSGGKSGAASPRFGSSVSWLSTAALGTVAALVFGAATA